MEHSVLKKALAILAAVLLLSAAPVLSRARKLAARSPSAKVRKATVKTKAKKTSAKRSKSRRQRGQKAPTSERIREIQSALARERAYEGEPDGKWDAASVEAMKRFQAAHGLSPTGKFDALSLQKLGLGSEVAGVAAPRPRAQTLPAAILPSR